MKTTTIVYDWFAPNEDARPLVVVLETPDDWEPNGEPIPELEAAFYETYKDQGYEVEEGVEINEYVFEVFSVEIDLSSFKSCTEADWLRVSMA